MVVGRLTAILGLSLSLCALSSVQRPVEICLARCRENIEWVDEFGYGDITTVYDKCGVTSGPGHHIERPNLGRESGTYLQHIVDHYDDLADWTVFSQAEKPTYGYRGHRLGGGHMMRNVLFQDYVEAGKTREENPLYFVFTSVMLAAENRIFQCIRHGFGEDYTQSKAEPFKEKMCGAVEDWHQWYEFPQWFTGMVQRLQMEQSAPISQFDVAKAFEVLGVQPSQGLTFFAQGARFAASREAIQARPKVYYEGLLEHLHHQDPWAGYFMEWLWFYVLGGSNSPCGFEEPVVNGHLAWRTSGKGRQDVMELQSASGVSGNGTFVINSTTITVQIEDLIDGSSTSVTFASSTTFTIVEVITTVSLYCSGTLSFTAGLTFTNANQDVRCAALDLGGSSAIVAANVVVTTLTVGTTAVLTAVLAVTSGQVTLGTGATLTLASSATMVSSQVSGSGTLVVQGTGKAVVLQFVLIVVTITITLTKSTSSRRTNLATLTPLKQCGTVNLGTLSFASGTAAIIDLSCTATQSGYTSYSNYIATLSPSGGLLYLTGVSSTSKPTLISTWNNVATTPIEIDNVTTSGGFCVPVLLYGTGSSCTTSWGSVTYDSCQSGYSCALTGGTYSGDSTKCAATFCQTASSSSNGNPGLFGLIALIAILPIGGVVGYLVWYYYLRTPAEEVPAVAGAYYYPQPYQGVYPQAAYAQPVYPQAANPQPVYSQAAYPQPVYPQAAYPQAMYPVPYTTAYPAYGVEPYPFQGYTPGLAAPMPTPLGYSSL